MTSVAAGHLSAGDGDTSGIEERLSRAASRTRWDSFLVVSAIAAAFGAITFAVLLFADALDLAATTSSARVTIAIVVALMVEAAGVLIVLRDRRHQISFARAADRAYGLDERISTAIELAAKGGAHDAVGRALMADAGRHGIAIEPARLSPIRIRLAVTIVAGSAILAALAVLVDLGGDSRPASTTVSTRLSQQEQTAVADDLQRIEAILSQDAEARDDPFLRAVAREVADLTAQIEAGEIADRAALTEALDELASYAAEAYELGGEALGSTEDLSRLLDALAQDVASPTQGPTPPEAAFAPQSETPAQQPAGETEPSEPSLDDLLAQAEADQMLRESRQFSPSPVEAPEGAFAEGSDYYAVATAEQARLRAEQMNSAPQEFNGGALAGGAQNSEAGDSRLAGEGVSELGSAEGESDPFAVAGQLLLEDELDAEGRRITIDVPPEEMDIRLDPGEVVAGEWVPLTEEAVTRTSLSLAVRDVVSRYFRAAAEAEVAE